MKKLAIDPSLNFTGWAISEGGKIIDSGVIKPKGDTIPEKLYNLRVEILNICLHSPDKTIIEIQDTFGSYFKRQNKMTGKGLNQEALNKQNWAIGSILSALYEFFFFNKENCIELIKTTQWKGRMNKKQAKLYASNICKREIKNDNEAESILLSLQ